MTNTQVIAAWVARTKAHGAGSHLRFEGTLLYSYKTTIAWICTGRTGKPFVIVRADWLSSTTNRHRSEAVRAARAADFEIVNVKLKFDDVAKNSEKLAGDWAAEVLAQLVKEHQYFVDRARRMRTNEHLNREVERTAMEAARFSAEFGLPCPITPPLPRAGFHDLPDGRLQLLTIATGQVLRTFTRADRPKRFLRMLDIARDSKAELPPSRRFAVGGVRPERVSDDGSMVILGHELGCAREELEKWAQLLA